MDPEIGGGALEKNLSLFCGRKTMVCLSD